MHAFYDARSLERALALPLDAKLRGLLRRRVDHLAALDPAVADATYFLVVDGTVTPTDIEAELGWSPLVDLDGGLFGTDAYVPFHDFIADRGGWFELMYSTSNEAVVVMLVQDDDSTAPGLLALCRSELE